MHSQLKQLAVRFEPIINMQDNIEILNFILNQIDDLNSNGDYYISNFIRTLIRFMKSYGDLSEEAQKLTKAIYKFINNNKI